MQELFKSMPTAGPQCLLVSCVLTNTITLNDFGDISGERGFPPCWEALGSNARWCVRKGELGAGVP